jgi:phenylpyruvate tautomerase PptA (4-oxalocrotonate tautomerase family)
MPLVKVELARGKEAAYLQILIKTVMDNVKETLKLPEDDRNIRLIEHDPSNFTMKAPYNLLIEITLFSGRSSEMKKTLYKNIVDSLHDKLGIERESVFIVLNEQPLENWGVRGGVTASDINLGFKVDV